LVYHAFMISELTRFIIFACIGLFNSLFDTVLWRILVSQIERYPDVISFFHRKFNVNQYAIAQTISFLISSVSSYFLNKTLTFSDTVTQTDFWQIIRFSSVVCFSLVISVVAMNILTENNKILSVVRRWEFVSKHWPIVAKLITIAITMVTNFVGYRIFVF